MYKEIILFVTLCWPVVLFAQDTILQLYRPFTETTKQSVLIINTKKDGQCLEQSKLIKREDAWRCVADGKNYDPCFVKPFGSHLNAVCPQSPWLSHSIEIKVAAPLDNSQHVSLDMSQAYPWGIELVTGEKCLATDSTQIYDSLPIRYQCEDQSVLFGYMQRCSPTWKMLQHSPKGDATLAITRAWF